MHVAFRSLRRLTMHWILESLSEVVFAETCVCLIIHSILDLADFTLVEFMPRMKKVIFYSAYLASHEFKIGKKSSNREFNGPKGVWQDFKVC
jgi:hypothetical protein